VKPDVGPRVRYAAALNAAAGAFMIACAGHVPAQDFPARPLRIVTAEAGGGSDFSSRIIAQRMSASLGQQVIVENRPSGVIPGEVVAKAQPNGHTLLLYNNILWIGPLIQPAPYDPARDFAPVSLVGHTPSMLVVSTALPVRNVSELLGLARTRRGELNYASTGSGASNHIAAELFKSMGGVDIVRVNYKGGGIALNAIMAGEVQMMFTTVVTGTPHVRSGKVRALAVTSAQVSPLAPELPTIAASGLAGFESTTATGIFAPARTPSAIVRTLHQSISSGLTLEEVRQKFFAAGMEIVAGGPDNLREVMRTDLKRVGTIIGRIAIQRD